MTSIANSRGLEVRSEDISTEKTILLVEDSPDDQLLIRRALTKHNLLNPVQVVSDGQEALDYLFGAGSYADRDASQVPTLILLDLKLPKIDGLEVLQRIRADERTKLLRVVILTSSKEEQDMLKSYSLGASSCVRKPVEFTEFAEAIRKIGLYWLVLNESPPTPRDSDT
ncbi:MAG: response regulator [Chloroflexi bacterium]|nr:response regulator [Chloroflexota bacterium]